MMNLELLEAALADLPAWLTSADGWRSLRIDYHPPFVDRAWRPWRDCRISIHRIYPCAPGASLFHPHPWPSAVKVLEGRYEMAVGYGAGTIAPPVAARIIANAGTVYTMTEPDGWHDVRPLDASVLTVMLSGPPWARATPSAPASPPQPLEPAVLEALIAAARARLSITRP